MTETIRNPTLVLLHPWRLDSRVWDANRPDFEDRYNVVAIDRRGTVSPPDATDLAAALMEVAPCPAAIVGLGEGADDALRVVMDGRVKPEALVLASPMVGWMTQVFLDTEAKREEFVEGPLAEWLQSSEAGQYLELAAVTDEEDRLEKLADMMADALPEGHPAQPLLRTMVLDNVHRMFEEHPDEEDQLTRESLVAGLANIEIPTLVVMSQSDDKMANALIERLPNVTSRVLPADSGLPSLEDPHTFDQIVKGWLSTEPTDGLDSVR